MKHSHPYLPLTWGGVIVFNNFIFNVIQAINFPMWYVSRTRLYSPLSSLLFGNCYSMSGFQLQSYPAVSRENLQCLPARLSKFWVLPTAAFPSLLVLISYSHLKRKIFVSVPVPGVGCTTRNLQSNDWRRVESGSLTRNQTWGPCIGSMKS